MTHTTKIHVNANPNNKLSAQQTSKNSLKVFHFKRTSLAIIILMSPYLATRGGVKVCRLCVISEVVRTC